MYHLTDNLSVCGYAGIQSPSIFSSYGFKAQFQCAKGFEDWLSEVIEVKCLPFADCAPIPKDIADAALNFLGDHWDKDHRILISCAAGESRSVSLAICLLTLKTAMSFAEACKTCFFKIPSAYPHPATLLSAASYCAWHLDLKQLTGIYELISVPPPFPWSKEELLDALHRSHV